MRRPAWWPYATLSLSKPITKQSIEWPTKPIQTPISANLIMRYRIRVEGQGQVYPVHPPTIPHVFLVHRELSLFCRCGRPRRFEFSSHLVLQGLATTCCRDGDLPTLGRPPAHPQSIRISVVISRSNEFMSIWRHGFLGFSVALALM